MELNNVTWTKKEYEKLIEYLKEIGDEKYKNHQKKIIPGVENILGVQIPKLRVIAKGISLGNYTEFLNVLENKYFEEILIHGLIISYINVDYDTTLKYINDYLPKVNNWASCDIFCTKFKGVKNNKEEFLNFLKKCIETNKEYYIRFAVVMLKVMYIDEEHIVEVLSILDNIYHEDYYVKMAVAWTLCDCFIKFRNKSMVYFDSNKLDNFTYNKALQKIAESNRVDKDTKALIRRMKRK